MVGECYGVLMGASVCFVELWGGLVLAFDCGWKKTEGEKGENCHPAHDDYYNMQIEVDVKNLHEDSNVASCLEVDQD